MDVVLIDNVDTFESMFYMSLQIKVPKLMNLDPEEQIVSNYELFDDDKWSDLTIRKPVVFIGEDCIFAFDCSLFNTFRRLTSLSLQPKIYKK